MRRCIGERRGGDARRGGGVRLCRQRRSAAERHGPEKQKVGRRKNLGAKKKRIRNGERRQDLFMLKERELYKLFNYPFKFYKLIFYLFYK